MRQVQEIIHVVESEREAYLEKHLNPTQEIAQILWKHGIRNQYYYGLNNLILLSFEYVGKDFYKDMALIPEYPEMDGYLVKKRRRDVPLEDRDTTNWWAPLKILGKAITENPMASKEDRFTIEEKYRSMLSGFMYDSESTTSDIAYDEDDWSESIHI